MKDYLEPRLGGFFFTIFCIVVVIGVANWLFSMDITESCAFLDKRSGKAIYYQNETIYDAPIIFGEDTYTKPTKFGEVDFKIVDNKLKFDKKIPGWAKDILDEIDMEGDRHTVGFANENTIIAGDCD